MDILKEIKNLEDRILASAKPLTDKQKEALEASFGNFSAIGAWFTEDYLMVKGSSRHWDYYAGLEYVDDQDRINLPHLTIYSADDERVNDILEIIENAD